MAPDLAYAFGVARGLSHMPMGLVPVCLPITILGVLWSEALIFPFLKSVMPGGLGIDWPRFFASSGMPRSPGSWLLVVVSGLLGAGTHIFWDGLTHPGWWPTTALYPNTEVSLLGTHIHVAWYLWAASTAVGAALVYLYLRRHFPGPFLPRGGNPRFFRALVWALTLGVSAGLAWAISVGGRPGSGIFAGAGILMFLILLTVASLAHRFLEHRTVLDG